MRLWEKTRNSQLLDSHLKNVLRYVCRPTTNPGTSTCEVPSDVSRKLRADLVYDNGVVGKLTACLMVKRSFRQCRVIKKPLTHCTAR